MELRAGPVCEAAVRLPWPPDTVQDCHPVCPSWGSVHLADRRLAAACGEAPLNSPLLQPFFCLLCCPHSERLPSPQLGPHHCWFSTAWGGGGQGGALFLEIGCVVLENASLPCPHSDHTGLIPLKHVNMLLPLCRRGCKACVSSG